MIAPVPDVVNVRSPFEGALIVDPVMARSPVDPPPPPLIVIVFVAPVPDAVTPEPTKFRVVPAVDSAEPSSCTVIPLPPPEAANVIVSPDALVVIVILEPATRVNVSVAESATTSS